MESINMVDYNHGPCYNINTKCFNKRKLPTYRCNKRKLTTYRCFNLFTTYIKGNSQGLGVVLSWRYMKTLNTPSNTLFEPLVLAFFPHHIKSINPPLTCLRRTTGRLVKTNEVSIFKPIRGIIIEWLCNSWESESKYFANWFWLGLITHSTRHVSTAYIILSTIVGWFQDFTKYYKMSPKSTLNFMKTNKRECIIKMSNEYRFQK